MTEKKEIKTYLGLSAEGENDQKDSIEFDLITARQRGTEIRYLSISIANGNANSPEAVTSINVDENAFNEIKNFFLNLEWNA